MPNDEQVQIYLYHPYLNQSHRYTRQIISINEKTTCRDVLIDYIVEPESARLFETCLGFEREIQLDDCLFDIINRNQTIEEFKIVVRHIQNNHPSQRRRTIMRSPTVNNNNQSPHEINTNINEYHMNNSSVEYSVSELQGMTVQQQEQIEQNQQLLYAREQRLQYLNQQQTTQENLRLKHHIDQQEIKNQRLKALQNQITQQKTSNSTFENEFEILKQIFLNKEHELTNSLNKLDELTKQLDQLRKLKFSTNNEQSQNKTRLEKLKQELMIRNNLNEQQSRKIVYQREIFASKQEELVQLDHRIEELQQRLKKKKISQSPSNDFRTALNTVQDTLNNINMAEIEKRMVQLANSFNSIHTNGSTSITNQNDQINHSNSPKKTNGGLASIPPSKIAFASKSEIAATYMARSSPTTTMPSPSSLPSKSSIDIIDSSLLKSEEQSLPANLRLNDDILSVHYNNITSNIKKRHSISDPNDLLTKYLTPNIDPQPQQQQQQQPIQVRDDSLTNPSPTIIPEETIPDFQKIDSDEEQQQTIMESFTSDTESEGSISEDIESTINSFSIIPITNLKSLLKTPTTPKNTSRRVIFDPLALLLDAAVLGEMDLVIKSAREVKNPSQPNDEGLTALHNAVCASNFECIKFLVEFGCDINYADNDGWTPLHCAASCNNTLIVKFLIEHGACIYATTIRDNEIPLEKCEEEEENYLTCSEYLLNIQNDLGVINGRLVYALYDYEPNVLEENELEFKDGDHLIILRREDENEKEWWWAKHENTEKEGYVPRNYLGLYPRIRPDSMPSTNC